ncbi:MAG: hypothetical protein WDZ30_12905 [Cellvibrionaceae bacterium]
MNKFRILTRKTALAVIGVTALGGGAAVAQESHTLLGTNCAAPPVWHCPDSNCDSAVVTQPGNNVEPKTRRTFFLDCPADYTPGDKVNIVLSLHGGGSYANWQRNYFPVMDVKDKHNLVVITPGSPTRVWTTDDDEYLRNMVDLVVGAVGKENVERFIMAGHSQGGATSSRLVCTDYFRDKVDVRISLSGGRVGSTIQPEGSGFFGLREPPVYLSGQEREETATQRPRSRPAASGPPGGDCDYSFIFAIGEYEQLPTEESPLAEKYSCDARVTVPEVLDPKPGYVWDSTRQDPGSKGWGGYPKSGRSVIYQYPNCEDGRVVADVVKLKKGHTEGYEPNITDKIMEVAVSAKGGKIAEGDWTPPEPPAPQRGLFGG